MKDKKIIATGALSLLSIGCVCGAAIYNSSNKVMLKAQTPYTCCEVTLTETTTTSGPSTTTTIDLGSVGTLTGFQTGDLTYTNIANSAYSKVDSDGNATNPIKIGGSKSGKYAGSFTLTSSTYSFGKVIVYATGWAGDNATSLIVNNISNDIATTAKGATYTYSAYTYEFDNSSTLTFSNATDASNKQRVLISKIVFRAYTL